MKSLEDILSRYKKADEYERTVLFLAYRDLRDVFMEIDLRHLPVIEEKATCRCLFRAS